MMEQSEANVILSKQNAAIIAPAGHGKTEMVADIVSCSIGKQLVITHTNAGVESLKKRFLKKNIKKNLSNITTIASYCMRWCNAYPNNAKFDISLDPHKDAKIYYLSIYNGMLNLLDCEFVRTIIKSTYCGVIVDEYQDCTDLQHRIFLKLNTFMRVIIFGDPLQAIFSFGREKCIDWNNIGYEIINIRTEPWRWINTNQELGSYLSDIRIKLLPILNQKNVFLNLNSISGVITHYTPDEYNEYKIFNEIQKMKYNDVLYLTKWEREQLEVCKSMPGIFQFDELQDCKDLYNYAADIDNAKGTQKAIVLLEFLAACCTSVNTELASYINHLREKNTNFSRISKYCELTPIFAGICDNDISYIVNLFEWFKNHKNNPFKFYRLELFNEMFRSINYAISNDLDIYQSSVLIRNNPEFQRNRLNQFKYLSSRTLLSKGLEFDCVIIDMRREILNAREFYVAMTRAKRMIYVISPDIIILKP